MLYITNAENQTLVISHIHLLEEILYFQLNIKIFFFLFLSRQFNIYHVLRKKSLHAKIISNFCNCQRTISLLRYVVFVCMLHICFELVTLIAHIYRRRTFWSLAISCVISHDAFIVFAPQTIYKNFHST